ncbi:MAG TPA: hypothetical protein VJM33_02600 [Microthrixaceae bacterium]|nr:hypothetical protein [Microthrixaceae bacterium]
MPPRSTPLEPELLEPDPEDALLLESAGLAFSSDVEPGLRRRRAGRGFSYRDAEGSRLDDETIARIRSLAIPPAWSDVWICPDPSGHLQATGRDARGRKQYRYHDDWRQIREDTKFEQLREFGAVLPEVRRAIDADLSRPGMPQEKVLALVMALLDQTLIRVGNDEYRRANGTFGLTTLYRRHVQVNGSTLRFHFVGKGGQRHEVKMTDRRLAAMVRRCHELGGREVFSYLDDSGELARVDSAACNEYLRGLAGDEVTVKTFRTWGATATVVEQLATSPLELDPSGAAADATVGRSASDRAVLDAIDVAARRLGNTRAVARRSYVHPGVLDAYADGSLDEAWQRSRRSRLLSRAERAAERVLAPDR